MRWALRILASLNLVLLALALFYRSPGEDPAGEALRTSLAVFYALALEAVLLLYRFVTATWARAAARVADSRAPVDPPWRLSVALTGNRQR